MSLSHRLIWEMRVQYIGRAEFLPILIEFVVMLMLFLFLFGGKRLVNFARGHIGTNPTASIWNFCDVVVIIGLYLLIVSSQLLPDAVWFPSTAVAILIALPIIIFRRMREKPDTEISKAKPGTIKTEIETSVYGSVLVGLLAISLTIVMGIIGHLAKAGIVAAAQTTPSTALVAGVIVLVAIVLMTLSHRKNTDRNFLLLALFLVVVAVLASGLYVGRLSPGLSSFQAVISGLALVVITPIANWIIHRNQPLRIVAQTALIDVIDWMSLGGRNAVPVVLLAATMGIVSAL